MARKRRGQAINGWLVLDKPLGLTSTQAVGKVRRLFDAQKAGHGGTLDPLATGVLPIALGEATKTVPFVMEGAKGYCFTLRWGQGTATDDAEGAVTETSVVRPDEAAIRAALPAFTGEIRQVPPIFSAIKVAGQRAYDLARRDEAVELAARSVRIDSFELLSQDDRDQASFQVTCGKGTYIRALARDLGHLLGTCAHVTALRRTATGPFTLVHAISLDRLEALGHSAAALEALLPVQTGLDDIPALPLTEVEASRLRNGQAVSLLARGNRDLAKLLSKGSLACAMTAGRPVAIVRYEAGDIRPVRVLNL
jgi:tRNA pseudouridine55 synthase